MMGTVKSLISRAAEEKHSGCPTKKAFTELVSRYQDMVFGLVYAILRDHFLAQDVTQETFIIAYNKLDTLLDPEAFPSWLKRIARRESIHALEKGRSIALPREVEDGSGTGDTLPEVIFERKEAKQQIRTALNNLPEGQRIPVVLYHIDGYSQGEIAEFLELQVSTVKKRIQRGRESMQKDLMGMFEKDLKSIRPSKDDRLLKTISLYLTFDAAAKSGQLDLLEQMLVDGVEINAKDAGGRALLHWAVENDHVEAARLLLKYGADRNIPDRSGRTAYQLAKKRRNPQVLGLFESAETVRQQRADERQ
jgi:RNA polymerase sigma-70 factor (ECF subfamily)